MSDEVEHSESYPWLIMPSKEQMERACETLARSKSHWSSLDDEVARSWLVLSLNKDRILGGGQ
jgi:hypothetical protein